MTQQSASKNRRELEAKMALVFSEKINGLSTELREILLDDMVTAFENRRVVLSRANANMQTNLNKEERNAFEILEPQVKKYECEKRETFHEAL